MERASYDWRLIDRCDNQRCCDRATESPEDWQRRPHPRRWLVPDCGDARGIGRQLPRNAELNGRRLRQPKTNRERCPQQQDGEQEIGVRRRLPPPPRKVANITHTSE